MSGSDLEALERVPRLGSLRLSLILHKGNVAAPRNKTHLLQAWEPGGERGRSEVVQLWV